MNQARVSPSLHTIVARSLSSARKLLMSKYRSARKIHPGGGASYPCGEVGCNGELMVEAASGRGRVARGTTIITFTCACKNIQPGGLGPTLRMAILISP